MIKQHRALRFSITVVALILTSSALLTGCKKDKREKIDLSSIHTTAAETMAPETSEAATTLATTTAETSEAVKDSTKGAAGVKNISTKLNTYTSGKVTISYPSLVNMENPEKASAIDALMKENALSILKAYGLDDTQDTLTIKCKVLSADRSRITATYTGTYQKKDGAYPVNVFYSNTIDVGKAANMGFSKFADPYTMAGYVLSNDCEFYNVTPELAAELLKFKQENTIETYTNWFDRADFPIGDTFPETFSYEHEGTIFFSIPVPHALGDYAIIKYTPDTK